MSRWLALGIVLIATILWGTTGTASALAPSDGASVGTVALGFGGLLLALVFPARTWRVLQNAGARRWVLIGAVAIALYAFAFYQSMRMAGVATGTALNLGSAPLFTAVLEYAVQRRGISRRWAVGIGMAVVGLAAMVVADPASSARHAPGTLTLGILTGLAAGALYATYAFASARAIEQRADPAGVMSAMFGLGAVLAMPAWLFVGAPVLSTGRGLFVCAYLAVFAVALPYWLFGLALTRVRASMVTSITVIEPVIASILASTLLGEDIGTLGWIGIGLIVGGVALATISGRRADATKDSSRFQVDEPPSALYNSYTYPEEAS